MMKHTVLLATIFLFSVASFCQLKKDTTPIRMICATPVTKQPLCLVDGFETDLESTFLDPNHIDRIDILKGPKAEEFGEKGKGGIIKITTRKETSFLQWFDFIKPGQSMITISAIELNGKRLSDIKKLLIDRKAIIKTSYRTQNSLEDNCITNNNVLIIEAQLPEKK